MPAPAEAPLARAARCYGAGDLLCVIATLQGAEPAAAEAAEHYRLLAFALARLDRPAEARAAMERWQQAAPQARLERSQVPPSVWSAWYAAKLATVLPHLDGRVRAGADAVPLPERATASVLPHFAPPPRSDRDRASDVVIDFEGLVGAGPMSVPWAGGVAVELTLCGGSRCAVRAGVRGRGLVLGGPDLTEGVAASLGAVVVWRPSAAAPWLELAADAGGGTLTVSGARDDLPASGGQGAVGAVVRGRWQVGAVARVGAGVGASAMIGADGVQAWAGLQLGVSLQPQAGRAAAGSGAGAKER